MSEVKAWTAEEIAKIHKSVELYDRGDVFSSTRRWLKTLDEEREQREAAEAEVRELKTAARTLLEYAALARRAVVLLSTEDGAVYAAAVQLVTGSGPWEPDWKALREAVGSAGRSG